MVNLDPRYRNYWLDLIRKEQTTQNEKARKNALANLASAVDALTKKALKKP